MSEGIKRMQAEREAVKEHKRVGMAMESTPSKLLECEAAMKMVDLAQPFIDEHATDPTKWKPSDVLRIGYCAIATGKNPKTALSYVERHLATARRRFKAGLDPNPFSST